MWRTATLVAGVTLIADAGAEGLYSHLYDPGSLSLESVVGMEVVAPWGERLGAIREVLFDSVTGKLEAIALDRVGAPYPIESLVSAESGPRIVAEPRLEPASAGASALRMVRPPAAAASHGFLIDLREGRVRRPE
jgi:PRC-barrel domain